MTADSQVLSTRAADTAPAVTGPANPTGAQLAAAFPPRPVAASWPGTEATRSEVLARVLSARGHQVVFVGTEEGPESRLLPEAGFEFHAVPVGSSPGETAALLKRERARWREVVTLTGIRIE